MVATFCLRSVASWREARTSASAVAPSAATRQAASFTGLFYRLGLRLGPVRLARPRDELQHALLHHLFEHAESRLLPDVEHLIDRLVGLAHVELRALLEILQRLHAIFHRALLGLRIARQPPQ